MQDSRGSLTATLNIEPHTEVEQAMRLRSSIMVRIDTDAGHAYLFATPAALEVLSDALATVAEYAQLPGSGEGRVSIGVMESAIADFRFGKRLALQEETADKPA